MGGYDSPKEPVRAFDFCAMDYFRKEKCGILNFFVSSYTDELPELHKMARQ